MIAVKDLLILAGVILIHLLVFVLGLWHQDPKEDKKESILKAELVNPPAAPKPPEPPKPTPPKPKTPPPPPKQASVAPADKKPTSKPQDKTAPTPKQRSEPITPNKTEQTVTNESAKPPEPVAPTNSSQPSSNPLGVDVGILEKSSIRVIYMPPDRDSFYPRRSKEIGEEGTVGMQIFWNERGEVINVKKILSSNFKRLDDNAILFAKQIRIEPYRVNGSPSPVSATQYMVFKLPR
jgi:protein TonB